MHFNSSRLPFPNFVNYESMTTSKHAFNLHWHKKFVVILTATLYIQDQNVLNLFVQELKLKIFMSRIK